MESFPMVTPFTTTPGAALLTLAQAPAGAPFACAASMAASPTSSTLPEVGGAASMLEVTEASARAAIASIGSSCEVRAFLWARIQGGACVSSRYVDTCSSGAVDDK